MRYTLHKNNDGRWSEDDTFSDLAFAHETARRRSQDEAPAQFELRDRKGQLLARYQKGRRS